MDFVLLHLFEISNITLDESKNNTVNLSKNEYVYLQNIYMKDQDEYSNATNFKNMIDAWIQTMPIKNVPVCLANQKLFSLIDRLFLETKLITEKKSMQDAQAYSATEHHFCAIMQPMQNFNRTLLTS
ncbi:maltase 1-like [Vespula maculifrons]|uniref:Maltase 1-like n=1 Tax=Vespula maculifrons TaxID=7453 RepID=A0ABD2CFY6_VESMC